VIACVMKIPGTGTKQKLMPTSVCTTQISFLPSMEEAFGTCLVPVSR
jgi:hypothetical protein